MTRLSPPNVKEKYKVFLDKVNQGEATATTTIADIEPITLTETVETTVEFLSKRKRKQQEKSQRERLKQDWFKVIMFGWDGKRFTTFFVGYFCFAGFTIEIGKLDIRLSIFGVFGGTGISKTVV